MSSQNLFPGAPQIVTLHFLTFYPRHLSYTTTASPCAHRLRQAFPHFVLCAVAPAPPENYAGVIDCNIPSAQEPQIVYAVQIYAWREVRYHVREKVYIKTAW